MALLKKSRPYTGRLAFDPDTLFHTDPDGNPVVTDDGGRTWRYASDDDASHNARYEKRVATVDSTANELARLAYAHGEERAGKLVSPHHWKPQRDDPHFVEGASHVDERGIEIVTHVVATFDDDKIGHLNRRVHEIVDLPKLIGRGSKRKRVPTDEIERGNPASTSHTDAWNEVQS